MADELLTALETLARRVIGMAGADADLRQELRRLAQAILEATEEPRMVEEQVLAATAEATVADEEPDFDEELISAATLAASLWTSPAGPTVASAIEAGIITRRPVAPEDSELQQIEIRCRLKAEGSRWAASRQRRIAGGADFAYEIVPLDREIIDRAKKISNCFLWMNHPDSSSPENLGLLDQLGDCFETLADTLALIRSASDDAGAHSDVIDDALDLLAESQSALRIAVSQVAGAADHDQQSVFSWLRRTGSEKQIFIKRHMRIDDPADPANSHDLAARIEALDDRLQMAKDRDKKRHKLMGKVRYEAGRIRTGSGDALQHWGTVIHSIDELIGDGVPPSNRELRELLLPIVDALPDVVDIPANVERILREIDRHLATIVVSEAPAAIEEPSEQVRQVAQLLKGKALVLIGGERRPYAHQAIMNAFGLSELIWVETTLHESFTTFEKHVARNDVAAVLLAIRWSSHGFGDVQQFCEKYGKPLVRLLAGYNPNQIASQIIKQCSERLAETR